MTPAQKISDLLASGHAPQALKAAQSLARAKPKDPQALDALARGYAATGDTPKALATYDRLIRVLPKHPKPRADKAHLLQLQGDAAAANEALRAALKLAPLDGSLLRMLSATDRLSVDDPAVQRLRSAWDTGALPPAQKIEGGFALAAALGADGLSYLSEANALQRRASPWSIASRQREITALQAALSKQPWPKVEPITGLKPIFVTGMPRSGTTLVEQILTSHSTVKGLGESAIPLRAAYKVIAHKTGFHALSALPPAAVTSIGTAIVQAVAQRGVAGGTYTDKTITSYMIAGLLKHLFPDAVIVFVRRDPRDIGWSIYRNYFRTGSHGYSNDLADIARQIKTVDQMVAFWHAQMPGLIEQIVYEDLVRDPEPQIRRLLALCGLPWEDACLHPERNTRAVATLSIDQVRQPIGPQAIGGWRARADYLAPLINELGEIGAPWD